ncbi:MAG: amidohydrolase [Candidatus Odinarchaeota archaeon]
MLKIDLLVFNGHVITCDDDFKDVTAFTVHNGRFLTVAEEPDNLLEPERAIDLEGKTVIPGFFDGHTHLSQTGFARKFHLNLDDVKSRTEFLERVEERVKSNPEEWLIARGWDESMWDDPELVTLEEFDAVTGGKPAVARRIDGHTSLVNTRALELLAIPFEHEGVEKDVNGLFTGYLKDIDLRKRLPESPPQMMDESILDVCYWANSLGITSACEMTGSVEPDDTTFTKIISSYFRVKDRMTVRVCLYPSVQTISQLADSGLGPLGDDMLRICGQKLFLDGSFGAKTAAITQGYDDGSKGLDLTPEAAELVKQVASTGWQSTMHAIGDRGIARAVEIIESVGISGLRIEHVEFLDAGLLERLARANVFLSMQPNFNQWAHEGGLYENRIGNSRLKLNPFRKVIDSGITLAFGSDGMPMDPLLGIYHAVNHPVPEFTLTPEQAIKAYTLGAARATGVAGDRGSISPGKLADFVVLDKNPLTVGKGTLKDIKVVQTFLGGKKVYPYSKTQ